MASNISGNILNDIEANDSFVEFSLNKYPLEEKLCDLTRNTIKCKGNVSIRSVKKLIVTQLSSITETLRGLEYCNIEIVISLPSVLDNAHQLYVLIDNLTMSELVEWCEDRCKDFRRLILLYRYRS